MIRTWWSRPWGRFFKLPVIRISDNKALFEYIDKLKKRYTDFTTIGTTAHNEDPVYSIKSDFSAYVDDGK